MKFKILLTFIVSMAYLMSIGQSDIISASDFAALVKSDKNLRIIDASKESSYKTSHLKNAVNIPHLTLYKDGDIEGLIKSPADLAKIFGSKGISETNTIVIYDGGSQKYSTRVYWILKYLGAPNVKILHKNNEDWKKARLAPTRMATAVKATTFTPKVNSAIAADMAAVKAAQKDTKTVIVDVRKPDEFNGTSTNPVSDGHIPGAVNINHLDVLTATEAFKSKAEIEKIAASKGISADKTVILYCKTSVRAGVLYVAFTQILGYKNVKVYDGAYNEWVASNTVEK
jgi:thiosulfate/3-mercaptopyruvate sulfurtransferase